MKNKIVLYILTCFVGMYAVFLYLIFRMGKCVGYADKWGIVLLDAFICGLPKKITVGAEMGVIWGKWAYCLKAGRRKMIANLYIAFGNERSAENIETLLKKSYERFMRHSVELFYYYAMPIESIRERFIIDERMIAEICEKNKTSGIQMMTFHHCQINLLPMVLGFLFDEFYPHAVKQPNKTADHFFDHIRTRANATLLKKNISSAFTLLKKLRNNKIIAIAGDYNANTPNVFHPFFGVDASVVPGVYFFAAHTRCPVYMAYLTSEPNGLYRMTIKELEYDKAGDKDAVSQSIVSAYFKETEQFVRAHPEEYIWLNYRWKTRPPGDTRNFYTASTDELKSMLGIDSSINKT